MNKQAEGIQYLQTVGLVVIKDNKLLLAFSNHKKAWYLPGGKVDAGETVKEALLREIEEELNLRMDVADLHYYGHISAPAYGEKSNIQMEQDCYRYELEQEIQPGQEIADVQFFDYQAYKLEPVQVPGVVDLFQRLRADKLLS